MCPYDFISSDISTYKKYTHTYTFNEEVVHYDTWLSGEIRQVKIVLFLGTVQVGKIPKWIVKKCPQNTLVVQGAPHWLAKDDGSDIPDFMYHFTKHTLDNISGELNHKIVVIADSQAAPAIIKLLGSKLYSNSASKIILIQPLGLNSKSFTGDLGDRIKLFKTRVLRNFLYQLTSLISDRRLVYNHRQLYKIVNRNKVKSDAQYNAGLAHSATNDLKNLFSVNKNLVIICGGKDKIFPPFEIKSELQKAQVEIPLIIVPNIPHSPLATKFGMKLLNKALEQL